MKEGVAQSQKSDNDNSTHLLTDSERDEWYKRHMDQVKEVLNDDRFSKSNMQNLEQSWNNVMLDEYANVNKCHGKQKGGNSTLEWFGTTGQNMKRQKRKKGRF